MSFRVQTMFALHALVSVCMYDGSRLQHRLRAVPAVKPEAAPSKAIQHCHVLSCLLAGEHKNTQTVSIHLSHGGCSPVGLRTVLTPQRAVKFCRHAPACGLEAPHTIMLVCSKQ